MALRTFADWMLSDISFYKIKPTKGTVMISLSVGNTELLYSQVLELGAVQR